MKKSTLTLSAALAVLLSLPVQAAFQGENQHVPHTQAQAMMHHKGAMGGFSGPSAVTAATVKEALDLKDDTYVTLRGNIVKHLGGEKYLFKDATGEVKIEIDDDDWQGLTVGPQDTVEIYGEVDKGWTKTEIDVESITPVR